MTEPIILLHGLGGRPVSLSGIRFYLQWYGGFKSIHSIEYDARTQTFDQCVDEVDRELQRVFGDDRRQSIIVVGQSMGGAIGAQLHSRGWIVSFLVTIGSPMRGARILHCAVEWLPTSVVDYLKIPNYEHLLSVKDVRAPPHSGHCITMAWPFTDFDGCVFVDEARFDEWPHTHLAWADHRTVFANPRLWHAVYAAIADRST